MNSRIAVAGVLTLALLVTVGTLGYRVTRQFLRYQATEKLFNEIYNSPYERTGEDILDTDITHLRRAAKEYGGDRIEGMLVDRLASKVWYAPDEANATLTEIFERTPPLTASPDMCPFVVSASYLQTWAYQAAVLPEMVEKDADVVIARRPDLRSSVRNLQAYTRLMNDDLAGVRELAERELAARGNTTEARAFALSCHVILGDYESAQKYSDAFKNLQVGDINIQMTYLDLLIQQRRFKDALALARPLISSRPGNELAGGLAIPVYYMRGSTNRETREALASMAQSMRNPMSVEGAEAWVAGRLFEVTGNDKFEQRLTNLAAQRPSDFDVWAAMADSKMNRSMWLEDEGMLALWETHQVQEPGGPQPQKNATPSVAKSEQDQRRAWDYARGARKHASSQIQVLQSELLLARSLLYLGSGLPAAETRDEILYHLRLALSAEGSDAGEVLDRVPDYDMLLTDRRFQALRDADKDFAKTVHSEVEAYIKRRMDFFQPAMDKGEQARLAYLARLKPQER